MHDRPDTASAAAGRDRYRLARRLASAAVLIPVALGIIYWGGWAFAVLLAVLGWLMAVEWCRAFAADDAKIFALASGAALTAAIILTRFGFNLAAVAVLAVASGALAALALARQAPSGWLAAGVVYIGLPLAAAAWIRYSVVGGEYVIIWMLAVIWATDTGAFGVGAAIGGPKLAPRISPNKTWAGALGGVVAGVLVGWLLAPWLLMHPTVIGVILGLGICVIGQIGDLVESAIKRHIGIKDFGTLIPGHGGVLDRLDSVLLVAPAMAVAIGFLTPGYR